MSRLAPLRQRIKVIQSIQKTTSAMRLIAMSMQSRLRKKDTAFKSYMELLAAVRAAYSTLQDSEMATTATTKRSTEQTAIHPTPALLEEQPASASSDSATRIVIVIGSQKSLCGSFNEKLWAYIVREHANLLALPVITIGTHAAKDARQHGMRVETTYDEFSSSTLVKIAHQLTTTLRESSWRRATIFHTISRTFFLQLPHITTLEIAPYLIQEDPANTQTDLENYLVARTLQSAFIRILYDSLLAEQAARFLSMDTATRNAEELLAETRLDYNKVRQAQVTRELIELTSGYNND